MIKRKILVTSFIMMSCFMLFGATVNASIRTYITESELSLVKPQGADQDDLVYDNFNSNNIYLYSSSNLDSQYNRAIYADGFYKDDGSTGTWLDPSDESVGFSADFRLDFSTYDKHLIQTQHIYPYVKFRAAPNASGLNDTAHFSMKYNNGINDSWPELSGFGKSVTGVDNYEEWNFGGTLTTYIPTDSARLTFKWSSTDNGSDDSAFYDVDIYFVDKTAPTISEIYTDTTGVKKIGDIIYIKVRLNEKVTQSSSKIKLNFGEKYADFYSQSDSDTYSTLTYKYTIQEGDNIAKLDVSTSQPYLEERIYDLAGNVGNPISDFLVTSTVDSDNIRIDGTRPRIATLSCNSNNTIKTSGDTIIFTATFDENVNITSAPILALSNGVQITGTTGNNTNTCTFTYNIGSNSSETSANLSGTGISGGSIKDLAGNLLTQYTSLNNTLSNIKIDTTVPTVSFSPNGNANWATSNEIVINASDSLSGLKGNVYNYALILEGSAYDDTSKYSQIDYSNSFAPGGTLTLSGLSGKYKVYIKAEDNKGNIKYMRTNSFYLDNQVPIISYSADYSMPKISHTIEVNIADSLSGINIVTYKWYKEGEIIGDTGFTTWTDYSGINKTITYEAPMDGKYRLAVRTRDNMSNLATSVSNYFYFDKTPPIVNVTEQSGYGFESNKSAYNIQIAAQDSNGTNIDGTIQYVRYRWENTSDLVELSSGWTDVAGTITYNNGQISGEKYLHVVTRDNAAYGIDANRTYSTYRFTFDWHGPEIDALSLNYTGITNVATVDVTVDDTSNVVATAYYAFRDAAATENYSGSDWKPLTVSSGQVNQSVTKSDGTGAFKLHVKAYDDVGNPTYYISEQIMMDNDAGTGSIDIQETYDKNGVVNIALGLSEEPTGYKYKISEDGTNYSSYKNYVNTYEYTFIDISEGLKTIYIVFKDSLGNETAVCTDTVIVDKTPPSADVVYSPQQSQGKTNGNVVAMLTNIADNYSISENILANKTSMTFENNGTSDFILTDEAGNIGYITATVNWIDRVGPEISLSKLSDLTPSKTKDITVTGYKEGSTVTLSYRVLDDNSNVILAYQGINSGEAITLTGDGKQYIEVRATDEIGNQTTIKEGPYLLDNTPPVAKINYSTQSRTANSVTATISLDEGNITNNSELKSYIFNDNGTFEFQFSDSAGNTGTSTAQVSWIDKSLPTANISFSETGMTNNDLIVTISVEHLPRVIFESIDYSENGMTLVSAQSRSITVGEAVYEEKYEYIYNIEQNGVLTVKLIDVDTLSQSIFEENIISIDKTPPTGQFYISKEEVTNEDIDVTVVYADDVSNPCTLIPPADVEDLGGDIFRISQNGTYNFLCQDAVGNVATFEITIDNIDREINPYVIYDIEGPTNLSVTASVYSDDEEIFTINNNGLFDYVFVENGSFTFEVRDGAGNEAQVTAAVDWINKEGIAVSLVPSTETLTNQDIVLTLSPISEIKSIISQEGLLKVTGETNKYIVTQNGNYNFTVEDIYGNIIDKSIYISNIDKTVPSMEYVIEVDTISGRNYITEKDYLEGAVMPLTARPVKIDFADDEPYEFLNIPFGVKINTTYNIATITQNGVYEFIIEDNAGNQNRKTVTIDNFDSTPPDVHIVLSNSAPTNKAVIATVTADEEIMIVNNFNSNQKVFKENGSFTFIVSDIAGNEVEAVATVSNIDRTPPKVVLNYSTTLPTKDDVTVTLTADEPFIVKNNGGKTDYTFTNNDSIYFVVSDALGNETTVEARATNIDKKAPVIIIPVDTPILVPLKDSSFDFTDYAYVNTYEDADRKISVDVSNVDFGTPGNYMVVFSVTDEVGNVGTKTKSVDVIDINEPLGTRLNGLNPEFENIIYGDSVNISLFNVFDKESIYYLPERTSMTKVKKVGQRLEGRVLMIEKSSWYSILIVDKDSNYKFYRVFVAK